MNMLPPINEAEHTDETEHNVEQSSSIQHVSKDNVEQESSYITLDANQRSVVINESQPLARCSVLYLGTAIPSPDQDGIDSIQEPLSKRYPIDGKEVVRGIEAWLSIDENGLYIQFASDSSLILYYPIRSLIYCASIRFVRRTETSDEFPNGWRFMPLDSPDANLIENIQNPPLFAVIFQRTRHIPIDECHCFVAKTKQNALTFVQACCNAYQSTDSQQDCSKVPLYFKINDDGSKIKEIDNEIRIVSALDEDKQILDDQINNETTGFFYKTDQVPINSWQLWEHYKHDIHRSSSNHSSNSSSSRSSHRLASITSIPDIQQTPPESQPISTNNPIEQLSQTIIDPYASAPNVIRVERIKDINTGRDIFIRWLHDTSEVSEQKPKIQTPNYDFHVDFDTDYRPEKELSNEIQRLVLDDKHLKKPVKFDNKSQTITTHHKQKKSKKKHRHYEVIDELFDDHHRKKHSTKTHKKHRHKSNEIINPSPTSLMQQEFLIPSFSTTFHTIQLPSQPNFSPYWYFSM